MNDSATPLDGWLAGDVAKVNIGPVTNDIYGKLSHHVQAYLSSFHERLSTLNVDFELLNLPAEDLEGHLEHGTFTRIEVSIIIVQDVMFMTNVRHNVVCQHL